MKFPLIVQWIMVGAAELRYMALPLVAALPTKVQSISMGDAKATYMAPPLVPALPLKLQLRMVGLPPEIANPAPWPPPPMLIVNPSRTVLLPTPVASTTFVLLSPRKLGIPISPLNSEVFAA